MSGVSEADVAAAIGHIDEIIIREVVRTEASRHELRRALVLVKQPFGVEAGRELPPRMQRLVDLLMVALPEPQRQQRLQGAAGRQGGNRRGGHSRHAA